MVEEEWADIIYEFVMFILQAVFISCLVVAGIYLFEEEPQTNLNQFIDFNQEWIKTHEYDIETYNCVNFSQDMDKMAEMFGVGSEMMVGCPENGSNQSCHRWLLLSYNPQTGTFVDYSGKYPNKRRLV